MHAANDMTERAVRSHAGPGGVPETEIPLCVDLDGTLLRTDTLWESCLALMRRGFAWLLLPFWLLGGKAHLKRRVAELSSLDPTTLPYNEELVRELRRQFEAGRTIVLCTGADEKVAGGIAAHLGIFAEVMASDGSVNLTAARKRRALEARFGSGGFDYIGNSWADVPVWRAARNAQVANPPRGLVASLERGGVKVDQVYVQERRGSRLRVWLRAIRVHQWAKNLLVFVPLALSHRPEVIGAALAFLAFSFAASGTYLINDLLDLQADRRHAHKRKRPFASGDLSIRWALFAFPVLWAMAAGIALLLPPEFGVVLALYVAGTLAYSLTLKRRAVVDVIVLAGLYTIRIAAGGAATGIVISPWTMALSVFMFLSLAMVKRVSELRESRESETAAVPGRDYTKADIQQLSSLGGSAGYMTVLVTALYIHSEDVQKLYSHPQWLWLMLPILLYWVGRIWLYASRGWINQDPVLFALKDRTTYLAALLAMAIAALAV